MSNTQKFSYLSEGMIAPVLQGGSIANIPASVCAWLGCPAGSQMMEQLAAHAAFGTSYQHVIQVIVDGLGTAQLNHVMERLSHNPFVQRIRTDAVDKEITSVVPSTTAAALTTLWTGASPGMHGIVGYEVWQRDLGIVMNYLPYAPVSLTEKVGLIAEAGIPAEMMFPVETLGTVLARGDVLSRVYLPAMLTRTPLTKAQMTGTRVIPYRRFGDLWASLLENLTDNQEQKTFDSIYWNDVDTYNHLFGMENERVYFDLDQFFQGLDQTARRIAHCVHGATLLILTADHGHIPNTADPNRDLKNHPDLLKHLTILPCGENRLTYFYPKSGHDQALCDYIAVHWDNQFMLVPSLQMIADGMYGRDSLHPDLENRVGEWIAIAKDQAYFWWPKRPDRLHSRHGGLSKEEMLVPLIGLKLVENSN